MFLGGTKRKDISRTFSPTSSSSSYHTYMYLLHVGTSLLLHQTHPHQNSLHPLINQRTTIPSLRIHRIPHRTPHHHATRNDNGVIHRRSGDVIIGRPDAPENHKCHVTACEEIVEDAEEAGEMPRAPDEGDVHDWVVVVVVVGISCV